MIHTCPKCSFPHKKRDNFCIECGKDLNNKLKVINFKDKLNRK